MGPLPVKHGPPPPPPTLAFGVIAAAAAAADMLGNIRLPSPMSSSEGTSRWWCEEEVEEIGGLEPATFDSVVVSVGLVL